MMVRIYENLKTSYLVAALRSISSLTHAHCFDIFPHTSKTVDIFPRTSVFVDIFPHTSDINPIVSRHVETVCLLVRRNSLHIDIDVDVEEMLQEKRGQATYPQIKEYVLEQTGLKVSSLYISQVKRKCGLDVGDSYNKPKSEDAKVPQCPPEKEKAIMDALKHYGMIS